MDNASNVCSACRGRGFFEARAHYPEMDLGTVSERCRTCGGTGRREEEMMRAPMVGEWRKATDGRWYGEARNGATFRRVLDGDGWAYEVGTWGAALRGDVPWDMPAPDPAMHPSDYTWTPWPIGDARAREAARAAYWLTD